jgi:hypothetical protein
MLGDAYHIPGLQTAGISNSEFRHPSRVAPETALPHKSCSSVHVENRPEYHIYAEPAALRSEFAPIVEHYAVVRFRAYVAVGGKCRRVDESHGESPLGIHSHKRGHARNFLQSVAARNYIGYGN